MSSLYRTENGFPIAGGDRILYTSVLSHRSKRLIYVNGIWNGATGFKESCDLLCSLTDCDVLGVFNQSGTGKGGFVSAPGRLFDIGQVATDWGGVVARGLGWKGKLLNGCAKSIYELLREHGTTWPEAPICIVAHSQGNAIVSNALMYYAAMARKGLFDAKKIHVFAVASPAPSWPTNKALLTVDPYWHQGDVVAWLSMTRNMRGSFAGEGSKTDNSFLVHAFAKYANDPPLIRDIRFRMNVPSAP